MNLLAFIILFFGILSRTLTHWPNFTPVVALALFGGAYLKKDQALIVPLALMIISDIIIGFHDTLIFTWGSVVLIAALGIRLKSKKSAGTVIGYSLASAIVFFLITNLGSWLTLYPRTMEGLLQCYAAAVPFFRNTLISALIYSAVFFGAYESVASRIKDKSAAKVLLS